ncbi:hypothetical protein D3C80_2104230 [compost metagenome]
MRRFNGRVKTEQVGVIGHFFNKIENLIGLMELFDHCLAEPLQITYDVRQIRSGARNFFRGRADLFGGDGQYVGCIA